MGLPSISPQLLLHPHLGLTTSSQQRRRLRPGAPKTTEARLGHTRTNCEGVARGSTKIAQHALGATLQNLHLGEGHKVGEREKGAWGGPCQDPSSQRERQCLSLGQ